MPYVSWDKGKAILYISERLKDNCLPIYIGDDTTDEFAFRTISGKGITIRIGKSRKTSAEYYLKGYWEVLRLLNEISVII